jgi:penicillin-binding protein 1B
MPYPPAELRPRDSARTAAPPPRPGTWAPVAGGVEIFLRGFPDAPDPDGQGGPERVRLWLTDSAIVQVRRYGGAEGATPADLAHPPRLEPVLMSVMLGTQNVRRTWVGLDRIPQPVRDAIVTSEDRRFYGHFGVDVRSWVRALFTNVRAGDIRQGASTITQQLARGLFLGRERTFTRKLREAGLAVGLEILLSKREILEMYLNSVYWGRADGYGVAGVAEASRYFFGTPVESLGVAQATLLAGLIPAPNSSSPFRNPRGALARRESALRDMLAAGVVDSATARLVRRTPLPRQPGPVEPERFPSYAGAAALAVTGVPHEALERRGLVVFTHLDLVWQRSAEENLALGVADLERRIGRRDEPLQGAFILLDPATGGIRALVGGRDARRGDFDRASRALRQCGSAIKPIVYAAALDPTRRGPRFTPASILSDQPRTFETDRGPWKPQNDDREYHETVTLAKALCHSINVATTNLVDAIGAGEVARYAERFGLTGLKPVASIGLGSNEVTLRDLTTAFSVFPAGGMRHPSTPVQLVVDARGHLVFRPDARGTRAIPAPTAALMTNMLEDVVIFGIAYPLRANYGFTRPLAGKTGTTNDYRDGWFVGFTPDLVAGLWVGYDHPQSLNGPAVDTALPLWAGMMQPILAGRPPTPFESDQALDLVWLDPWSGGVATPDCPSRLRVGMLPGTEPRTPCTRDHTADWERYWERKAREDSLRAVSDSTDSAGVEL